MPRAQDFYLGRIGGSRLWVWTGAGVEIVSPPAPDSGISGRILRRPWRLILGEPAGAQAFVYTTPRGLINTPGTDSGIEGHTVRRPWRLIFGSPAASKNFVYRPLGTQPVGLAPDSGISGVTTVGTLYYLGRPGGSRLWVWNSVGSAPAAAAAVVAATGWGQLLALRRNRTVARA